MPANEAHGAGRRRETHEIRNAAIDNQTAAGASQGPSATDQKRCAAVYGGSAGKRAARAVKRRGPAGHEESAGPAECAAVAADRIARGAAADGKRVRARFTAPVTPAFEFSAAMDSLLPAVLMFIVDPLSKKSTVETPTPFAIPKTFAPLVARAPVAVAVSTRKAPEKVLLVALSVVTLLPPIVRLDVPVIVEAITSGLLVNVLINEFAITLVVPAMVHVPPAVLFSRVPPLRIRWLIVMISEVDPLYARAPPELNCSEAPPNVKLVAGLAGVRRVKLAEYADPADGARPFDHSPAELNELLPEGSAADSVTSGSWASARRGTIIPNDDAKTKPTASRVADREQPLLRGTNEYLKRGEDLIVSELIID